MDGGEVMVDGVDGAWLLTLRGEHDLSTNPSLRDELERTLAHGSTVIVDLSEAAFIDSTVLRGLVYGYDQAAKHDEHTVLVVAPRGGVVRRLLDLTGLSKLLPVFESRAEALASLEN